MSVFEEIISLAAQLPTSEREKIARALGVVPQVGTGKTLLTLSNDSSRANPAEWRQSERGHAVLALSSLDQSLPTGPDALRGLWPEPFTNQEVHAAINTLAAVRPGSPVVVHTSVVLALAHDLPSTRDFWQDPPVEVRLSTASHLALLQLCETAQQKNRVHAFVQPYAVLSLGPMASARAVELMLASPTRALTALDALIAATAMAHEIPLLTRDKAPYEGIIGLQVALLP